MGLSKVKIQYAKKSTVYLNQNIVLFCSTNIDRILVNYRYKYHKNIFGIHRKYFFIILRLRAPPSNLNFEKIQIGGVDMYGSKDKPYELIIEKSEKEIHYYIIYLTEGRRSDKIEISEAIYQVYKNSELRQKSQENIFDRHIEHLDLTELQLQKRAIYKETDLENKVMDKFRNELLFEEIANLPDTQRSRFLLYYEMDYTYDQIAQKEGCSKMAVKYSIDAARKKIIEKIKKFES